MKNFIYKLFTIGICLVNIFIFNSYIQAHGFEIWIENRVSGTDLLIKFYPIGSLFNDLHNPHTAKYTLFHGRNIHAGKIYRRGFDGLPVPPEAEIKHIVGLDGISLDGRSGAPEGFFKLWRPNYTPPYPLQNYDAKCWLGSDASDNSAFDGLDGLFGYGKYMLEVYSNLNPPVLLVQIPIDWLDFNYPYPQNSNAQADLWIYIDNINTSPVSIKYKWSSSGGGIEKNLYEDSTANGHLEVYRQFFGNQPPYIVTPSTNFASSDPLSLHYPLDASRLPDGYATFQHENPGDLGMNFAINHNVTTQDTAVGNGNIYTASNGYLKIANGKTFHMTKPLAGFHNLIVQDSSLLWLDAGSLLIVDTTNRLTLKPNGTIKLGVNSEIVFEPGSQFCNEGGKIIIHEFSEGEGFGKITKKKGYHQLDCSELTDFVFGERIKLVLADSAVWEIPDSTTLHFSGNESGLIMKPNSKLKMGVGSKILFENSAKLIADSAEFCSINSANTWEGIVLENSS